MQLAFSSIGKLEPYFVGFDQLFDRLTKFEAAKSGLQSYPPYNIVRNSETEWTIEIAVAGFSEEDIEIEHDIEKGVLSVKGNKKTSEEDFIHKGIANREFTRTWTLQDYVEVSGANIKDGLLIVGLEKVLPEGKRPRKISIGKSDKKLLKSDDS